MTTLIAENIATSAAAVNELSAHLDLCPTCMAWHGAEDVHSDELCPTCGQASVEWDQALQIDALLRQMNGLAAVDAAITGLL